jgi:bifunctional DNA-binding transcriptional regulator/antitoxin component of YhaV-PrlF toxin-antitoxin module
MTSVRTKVTDSGRLSLPAEIRRAVESERSDDVVVELAGRGLRIRTVDEVVSRAQALTRGLLSGRSGITVDEFLDERAARQEGGIALVQLSLV